MFTNLLKSDHDNNLKDANYFKKKALNGPFKIIFNSVSYFLILNAFSLGKYAVSPNISSIRNN